MSEATIWAAVVLTSAGAYALKLVGLSLPQRILEQPRVQRLTFLLPVALLSALIAVLTFANPTGDDGVENLTDALVIDARAAGVAAAVVLLLLRAPFLVVLTGAAGTAALLRLLTG